MSNGMLNRLINIILMAVGVEANVVRITQLYTL